MPERAKYGGVQIMYAHRIFHRGITQFIACAISNAALEPAARQHIRERLNVMIAAGAAIATSAYARIRRRK